MYVAVPDTDEENPIIIMTQGAGSSMILASFAPCSLLANVAEQQNSNEAQRSLGLQSQSLALGAELDRNG